MYTVDQAFERLRELGITDNKEVVRRWLRQGKLKGIPPKKRRDGWRIPDEALEAFIAERVPGLKNVRNSTKVANETEEQLKKEIADLREQNQKLIAENMLLNAKVASKKPKGIQRKYEILSAAVFERIQFLQKMLVRWKEQQESEYFRGVSDQIKEEIRFLSSIVDALKLTRPEEIELDDLEKIKIYGS